MRPTSRLACCLLSLAAAAPAAAAPASPFPPGYEAAYRAYLAALPANGRTLSWLTRLDGVAGQPQPLTIGGKPVVYLFACANHECDTNNANLFLLPDRRQVKGVVKIRGVRTMIGGAGPAELACVAKLDASGGAARAC